jgi:hypothetical protein
MHDWVPVQAAWPELPLSIRMTMLLVKELTYTRHKQRPLVILKMKIEEPTSIPHALGYRLRLFARVTTTMTEQYLVDLEAHLLSEVQLPRLSLEVDRHEEVVSCPLNAKACHHQDWMASMRDICAR